MKDELCLQLNGECVCHHLNGPQRVHNILQLVLSQNPVWCKPGTQTGRQSAVGRVTPASYTEPLVHKHRRTWVADGIYGASLGQRSSHWSTHSSFAWQKFALHLSYVCVRWGGKCCGSSPEPWAGSWPPETEGEACVKWNWNVFHQRVHSTDRSTVPLLQEQSEEEAGLGEDAATLFGDLIAGLLSVPLQQIQQNFHRVFHRVHGLDGLVVLLREKGREKVKEKLLKQQKQENYFTFCILSRNIKADVEH